VSAHSSGTHHRHAQGFRQIGGFSIEVEENLHVVGDETDRRDNNVADAFGGQPL
jgi:hypothetical protein